MNDSTSDPQDMSQATESSETSLPAKTAGARKNTRKKVEPMSGVAGEVVLEGPAGFSRGCDAVAAPAGLPVDLEPAEVLSAPLSNADVPSEGGIPRLQSTEGKREAAAGPQAAQSSVERAGPGKRYTAASVDGYQFEDVISVRFDAD